MGAASYLLLTVQLSPHCLQQTLCPRKTLAPCCGYAVRAGHRYVGLIAMFSVLFLSFLWPPFCLHHLVFIAVAFQYILESENVSLFVPFQYFCCLSAPDSTWTKVGFPMSVEKASNLWMDSGIVSALTVARTGDFFFHFILVRLGYTLYFLPNCSG